MFSFSKKNTEKLITSLEIIIGILNNYFLLFKVYKF